MTSLDLVFRPEYWNDWISPLLFDDEEVAGLIVFTGCEYKIILGGSSSFDLEDGWLSRNRWDTVLPFHTHPLTEYRRNDLPLGWPSRDDVALFLRSNLEHGTRAHLVLALEGMYIITISKRIRDPLDIERIMSITPDPLIKQKRDSALRITGRCRQMSVALHPVSIKFHSYHSEFVLLSL